MLNHLIELRRRAVYVVCFFTLFFFLFFLFADNLFQTLVAPLLKALGARDALIATHITSPVLTPLKLAADAAFLCTAPFALLQLWQFIAPGLYRHERNNLRGALLMSLLLFLLGMLFCYYIVLPFMFQFFANAVPPSVRLLPDMAYALDFITRMLLIFGLCFQVPLVCLVLVRLGWVDLVLLKKIRPYVIVSAFTLGMLLTPPDVLSQVMLAVPLCLLYELGLFLVAIVPSLSPKGEVLTKE
ncbi:twin-arginine translocase subunit TatC [Legionella hackeliae]|uniref:Sec-independent protein translocase protein TatC n=1 Tax=Legionella hackeliae TaxID=449 RepID=A0A0A8UXE6_LEGHA|nr:twin-arginine translocase subunit TatC [Legionella hackeliae]KTD12758.1 sec-independent (periplasmic) protein translocase protein TatC [Legionella hackeliae]CEK12181.1 Sec-independent protein translocase protein tatC [Legionella hackeliae]STX48967.1 sec-independent (periplasmic) protein translocase protein TatC [Legionella hackeliae]